MGTIGTGLIIAGRAIPDLGKIESIGVAVAIGAAYLIALFIAREFNAEDRARFAKIFRKGRK